MSPERENALVSKYPELFRDKDKPVTESLMAFGCECRDGWYNILESVCGIIAHHIKSKPELADFRWVQIKEKYATLRLYFVGDADDYIVGAVDMAENLSAVTCEQCGAPGKCRGAGWLTTLCDACDNVPA